jgi:peptidyl-prolyl cis-trans isomerase SurA
MSRKSTNSAAALLALCWLAALSTPAPAAEELNRVVLRVNDQILTLHDFENRKSADVTAILADSQLSMQERQELIGELGPRIMHDMFRELLLLSRAKQLRVFISDREVDEAVRELAKSRGLEDTATFQQALEAAGLTLESLREKMRREMTWSQVVSREVTSKIEVGEEELRAHYRTHKDDYSIPEKRWLKEVIVLESSGKSPDELQRLAAEIRNELAAGGEIEAVIEPYREAGLTTGVIDLDWLRRDELEATLAEAAFALEPGAFSEPVKSRGGLHVLHLAGLEEAKLRPFDEVQNEILGRERNRRFDRELRNYLAELERGAYVQEDLPPEAVGYRSLASDYSPEEEIELFRRQDLPARPEPPGEGETGGSD